MQRNLWADMMFLKLKTKDFRFQIHLSEKYINNMKFFITRSYKFSYFEKAIFM